MKNKQRSGLLISAEIVPNALNHLYFRSSHTGVKLMKLFLTPTRVLQAYAP